jgi:hypothetical protein
MVAYTYNLAPRRLRWADCKFEASLGYIAKPCLKKQNKTNKHIRNLSANICQENLYDVLYKLGPLNDRIITQVKIDILALIRVGSIFRMS